ncbi:GNAT family N-acetyltransferase [Amphiplicatus metriothermophilus]|uniref:Protein N-acetyltransferase, RimJ/RimL family n=1 Tax=Amphiplicatus metriothermophilus TaxID=1519374 RepID=A0A239PJM8_9PROT|nr:GNAT family N-acetyltransferase [Amphiplicatus metriothermophilus]MBB5517819.1 RimJ/RimL family protein N-acetyltransferase [Amphiplicatus metriothermophilus]SNT67847.1 Protein N-acetyltransferase, RimJ/RimL family [Amphiplicatus metriothermophilus]
MSLRLETERLLLRPLAPEDVDAYCAMMAHPDAARFLTPDGKPQDRPAAWRGFATLIGHWAIRGYGMFAVVEKDSGDVVGRVGPWMPEGWPGLECGWGIAPERWGRGYAPEAAVAAIRWTFDRFPDLPRIISVIDPRNENSQAVARKIGQEKTGEAFSFWGLSLDIWAVEREAWLARFG